eukprot:Sspe_Gene.27001::Locus_11437_Transcript_3_5_Confidence_0.286_Length_6396::g.27001::m.27001
MTTSRRSSTISTAQALRESSRRGSLVLQLARQSTNDLSREASGVVIPVPTATEPAHPSHMNIHRTAQDARVLAQLASNADMADRNQRFNQKALKNRIALHHRSLFLFSGEGKLRVWIFDLTHHRAFEALVIFLIFANCIFLALDDPTIPEEEEPEYLKQMEYFFTAAFTLEMCLKVFALGFILHPGSYLRNGWNILDFLIVVISWLAFLPFFGNYSAIRMLRVLRPLRSINGIQGLKNIVNGLLFSVRKLVNVLALAAFLFFIFGILGVQLWAGLFTYQCQQCVDPTTLQPCFTGDNFSCACQNAYIDGIPILTEANGADRYCKRGAKDIEGMGYFWGRPCDHGYTCVDTGSNPNNGFTNFDHVGYAFLAIFQCLTMEGWVDIMYIVQDVWGTLGVFYFVLLVILGSFFVLNLALAVINEEFNNIRAQSERDRWKAIEAMHKALIEAEHQLMMKAIHVGARVLVRDSEQDEWQPGFVTSITAVALGGLPTVRTDYGYEKTWLHCQPVDDSSDESEMENKVDLTIDVDPPSSAPAVESAVVQESSPSNLLNQESNPIPAPKKRKRLVHVPFARLNKDKRAAPGKAHQLWLQLRWMCFTIVTWRFFQPFIIACIVINTALLAIEHHNQPDELTDFLEMGNLVLTMIFLAEMILKLLASGFRGYVEDRFNVLDGIVVIMSLVEFAMAGSSTVSVFRALRLLRVFKLLKNFPELRTLISVILHAVSETGYLNLIILLYIFIAALVGMRFFGGEFNFPDREEPVPRATFNSFYWSFLTVFQILTRDDWVVVMWDAMLSTGHASCIYFLILVVCGDFLILNLFLAILIQSFDRHMCGLHDDEDEDKEEVAPPEAPSKEVRHRQSLLAGDPILHRASAILEKQNKHCHLSVRDLQRSVTLSQIVRHASRASQSGSTHLSPSIMIPGEVPPPTPKEMGAKGEAPSGSFLSPEGSGPADPTDSPRGTPMTAVKKLSRSTHGEDSLPHLDIYADGHHQSPQQQRSEVYEASSEGAAHLEQKNSDLDVDICPRCGEFKYYDAALPLDKALEAHGKICKVIQLRKARQRNLGQSLQFINHYRGMGSAPRREHLEYLLGTAWEVGLLLDTTIDDLVRMDGWEPVAELFFSHLNLLDLRPGEEIVGKALVTFTKGNLPPVYTTNGGNSLCLFGPKNEFRILVYRLVKHKKFDAFILLCILVSSLLMAIENPRNDQGGTDLGLFLHIGNILFTAIFVVEMCLKLIAFGLFFGKEVPDPPYLRDWWNVVDGSIVIVSVLSLALASSNLSILKVFRTFRALRPLRVIARNRGLRMVVITLMQSIGGIGHVALISFLVFLVFGILGVQLFSGKLHVCNDPVVQHRLACYGYYETPSGELAQRRWINKEPQHYDNIMSSLLTLFEISTLELWSSIMYNAIDAVGHDSAPRRDHNPYVGLFFVFFVIVGSFFILNLFVGVVIHNYNEVKVKEDGLHFLTGEQKLWIETQRMMLNFKPMVKMTMPTNQRRRQVYHVAKSTWFEMFIGICILLNVVIMSMEHHGMSDAFGTFVEVGNWVFALIFLLEAIIKITAFGLSYFKDPWNRFDFLLVTLSCLGFFLFLFRSLELPVNASLLRVFRIFRIMRILRLVKAARDVRILLETIWYSLPSIANIGAFLALLFFIYAILGVNLFALVKRGEYLTYHANFETFPNAALLLFRMVTGENWNGVMHDTMVRPPECGDDPEVNDCGHPETAPLYYISFLLMAGFVLTNLFVAIILDNFGTTIQIEKSELRLNDLHSFIEIWADFDPYANLTIRTSDLPKLLEKLGPPLGISRHTSRVEILKQTRCYCIPEHGGVVHFIETIIPLARQVMNSRWQEKIEHKDLRDQEESWRQAFPDINDLPVLRVRQRRATADHYFASTYIAAAYRRRRAIELVQGMHARHAKQRLSWIVANVRWLSNGEQHQYEADEALPLVPEYTSNAYIAKLHTRSVKVFVQAYGLPKNSLEELYGMPTDTAFEVVSSLHSRCTSHSTITPVMLHESIARAKEPTQHPEQPREADVPPLQPSASSGKSSEPIANGDSEGA